MPTPRAPIPTEEQEQRVVVQWLEVNHIEFFHVPNGRNSPKSGGIWKAQGVKAGVPDLIIIDPPPKHKDKRGAVIEMKRKNGKPSDVSDVQKAWLVKFQNRQWVAWVGYGSDDAIKWLEAMGYGKR